MLGPSVDVWNYGTESYDFVYSPDDGGYYLQRHSDDATSPVFNDEQTLRQSLIANTIDWDL